MKRSHLLLLSIAGIIAFVSIIAISIWELGNQDIVINTTPIQADVKINDKAYKDSSSGTSYKVRAGQPVTIEVSREGFTTYKANLSKVDDTNQEFNVVLNPLTDQAAQLLESSEESTHRENITNLWYDKLVQDMEAKYPILTKLPHYSRYFTMSQGLSMKNPKDPQSFAIYIDIYDVYAEQGKSDSLQYIKDMGYDPNDHEIIFRTETYKTRDQE